MKKFLSFVAFAIMIGLSAFAAINWGKIDNLAKNATVTVSSKFGAETTITDDNNGTGWQAAANTHDCTQDWVLIDLGGSKELTDIEIVWEASHCTKYSVYVFDNIDGVVGETQKEEGGVEYKKINPAWLEKQTEVATGGNDSEAGYTENLTFKEAVNGRYILIYANEYNNFGSQYGMYIFEVRAANIKNRDELTELKLTQEGNAVAGGEAVKFTVTPYNKMGDAVGIDQVTDVQLTCENAAVTITPAEAGTFNVTATTQGSYILTATATADGNILTTTATLNVAYNWIGVTNVVTSTMSVLARVKAKVVDDQGNEVANLYPATNAIDGDESTYYQYNGEWGGGDSWVLVDLGAEYMVNAIGVSYGEKSGGRCIIGYATDATAILAKINGSEDVEGNADFKWGVDLNKENEGWNFTAELARQSDAVTTQVYDVPVVARYIAVRDADNPNGKPCVREIYVNGVKREASVATTIAVTSNDNYVATGTEVALSAVVSDQYGAKMEDAPVTFSCNGTDLTDNKFKAEAVGDYTIIATCGDLTAECVVSVVAEADHQFVDGADNEQIQYSVTVDGVIQTGLGFIGNQEIKIANLPAVLEYTFEKAYDFSLLNLKWEAACPSDYDVTVTYGDGTTATANVVTDRAFVDQFNPTDKILNAPASRAANTGVVRVSLQNVKKLTFNLKARKGHNYDLRLLGIDAYGTEVPAKAENVTVKFPAAYGTMILPFEATKPEDMTLYKVFETKRTAEGFAELDLVEATGNKIDACTPYIVTTPTAEYTFKGFVENEQDSYTEGYLTGVMKDTPAEQGSYVLQDQEGILGFYKVSSDDIKVPAYHAYLTYGASGVRGFVFNLDEATGIQNLDTSDALVNVYNMNGVLVRKAVKACDALRGLENGIYVVDGVKKAVKR